MADMKSDILIAYRSQRHIDFWVDFGPRRQESTQETARRKPCRIVPLPAMLLPFVRRFSAMASGIKKVPIPSRGVDYRGKIVLAPMVRSGELPSRLVALHYGADLVWGR